MFDTSVLDRAIAFAVKAHAGIARRGKRIPYIVHPLEALAITATMTDNQELLAATVLHDVVEDTAFTLADIEREFGRRVAELVAGESETPVPGVPESESWHQRRQATLDRIRKQSREAKMVALGDKLSNMRAISRDYDKLGDALWGRFHVTDPAEHAWHYRGLADSLSELADTEAYQEFARLVDRVFPKDKFPPLVAGRRPEAQA